MLKTRLSPNNSQISTNLLSLTRGTDSAKVTLIIHTKKRLQSCLHIFLANLKLPRMRYRKNAWNKIWGHPQFAWKKKIWKLENYCSSISVVSRLITKQNSKGSDHSGLLEINRAFKTHLILCLVTYPPKLKDPHIYCWRKKVVPSH